MISVREVNNIVENLSFKESLVYLSHHFKKVKFSTSFGEEDQVITHQITSQNLPIEIFTLDTGRLFTETYDLLAITNSTYKIDIKVYFPNNVDIEKYVTKNGINGFYESIEKRKQCCHVRKVIPLARALENVDVWITGLRANQSTNRHEMNLIEWDSTFNLIKYNPLLQWSHQDIHDYIEVNKVPTNSLHKKGFASIGCAPCTRAIEEGEDIRAGRWWWETSAKECGLHSTKIITDHNKTT